MEAHQPAQSVQVFFSRPTILFVSVNSKNRSPWLATDEVHTTLREVWREATAWRVGEYMIMPDHLHFFCALNDPDFAAEEWVTYWKRRFTVAHHRPNSRFQSKSWHHRIRSQRQYAEKLDYLRNNPMKAGLAKSYEEWPYKGTVFELNIFGLPA